MCVCVCGGGVCVCGGGGGLSGSPDLRFSIFSIYSEIKRIGRNDSCSPNRLLFDMGCKLISNMLMKYALDEIQV